MKKLHDIAKELSPAKSYKMLIGGEWVDSTSKETMKSYNPATGELLTEYAAGNAQDVELAVRAATKALPAWRKTSAEKRQSLLLKIADLLEAEAERFITLETLDGGKTQSLCRNFDIPFAIDHFRYFAGVIRAHSDASDVIDENTLSLVIREPIGVIGQIIPWNFPLLMAAWKIAPALAAGNTIVINPASLTPITLLELGRIINQVLPAGVVNIVTGRGSVVGQAILDHEGIDKVAFTSSTEVGYNVAAAAAKRLIPATLELGGKSANIVFPDANMKKAVKCAAHAILLNQGQACESGARLFLHKDIYDSFLQSLKTVFESIRVGDPMDPATEMSCQVSEEQMNSILGYIDLAKQEGATILTGGKRITGAGYDDGFFVQPTILTNVTNPNSG